MDFSLTILGTASALPFSDRNPSAQALSVRGRLYLIDCGEGTQQRFRQMHLSFVKVNAIFLSHIHGDHVFGLFGMLSTMSLYHRLEPLKIFAPADFAPVLSFFLSSFGSDLSFEVEHVVLDMNEIREIYADKCVRVSAFPLNHKIPCFGFRFEEAGMGKKHEARSYAYCSDTAPFPKLSEWVKGVDVLYHEATYPVEYEGKARQYFHSTTLDAARCAADAGAGKLLIGHYSSRVRDLELFQTECRTIFAETYAANDCDVIDFPVK